MAFPFPFGQPQPQDPTMMPPRVPWGQNPVVTMAGLGLVSGRNLNEGLANLAQTVPAGMAAKSGMQQFMLAQQERQKKLSEESAVKDAWNRVMIAKSSGQPIPADAQAIIAQSNPTIGAKMFGSLTGMGGDTSLNGIWGTDASGNPMIVQLTDSGTAVPTKLPEGFSPSKGVEKIDAGTEWLLYDKQTGNLVGRQPKNVAQAAAQNEFGTATGKNAAALPAALATGERVIGAIDTVLQDPDLSRVTGPIQGWLPNMSEGANRVQSYIDQIVGGAFLTAYDNLRGAGAITEQEGAAAKAAYTRLQNTRMGDADYRKALEDFRSEAAKLMELARSRAGALGDLTGGAQPASPAANSPVYTSPDGVKVYSE